AGALVAGGLVGARIAGDVVSRTDPVAAPPTPTALVSVDLPALDPVPAPPVSSAPPGTLMSQRGRSGTDASMRDALADHLRLPVAVVRCLVDLVGTEGVLDDPAGAIAGNPSCSG
ncbi:MAG: hypothetical protein S0880_37090, partial [Actinomycetota bacterium]|nr:hypothetical protein [Actinomycetota bacterium]